MLTRMVAFFFTAATGALIEIELFMLVLAMPLWLLQKTVDAWIADKEGLAGTANSGS